MNTKVLLIFTLVIVALGILTFSTFGTTGTATKRVLPDSLRPKQIQQTSSGQSFTRFENRDRAENFFSISVPSDWHVAGGKTGGSYALSFLDGSGSVELMDVPDNTTVELFVLSQDEPKLKAFDRYQRLSYKTLLIDNQSAYQLVFAHTESGHEIKTVRTYIVGADMMSVITLETFANNFSNLQPVFDTFLDNFHWLAT